MSASAPEPAPNLVPELYAARLPATYSSDDDSGLVDEVYSVNTSDENRLQRRRPVRSAQRALQQSSLNLDSDESGSMSGSQNGSSRRNRSARHQLLLPGPSVDQTRLQRTTMLVRSADRDLPHESLFRFRVSLSGSGTAQRGSDCSSEVALRGVRLVRACHASLPERIFQAPCAADQLPRNHLYLGFEGIQGQRRAEVTSRGAREAHQILHRSERDATANATAVFTAVGGPDVQDAATEPLRQAAAFTLTVSNEASEIQDTSEDLLQITRAVLFPQTLWDLADTYAGISNGGSSGGSSSGGSASAEISEVLVGDAARFGARVAQENIDRYLIRAVRFHPATAEVTVIFASEIPVGRLREGDRVSFQAVRIDRESEAFTELAVATQRQLLAIEQVVLTPLRARTVVRLLHDLPDGILSQNSVVADGFSEPGDSTAIGSSVRAAVLRVSDELTRAARSLQSLLRIARGENSNGGEGGDSAASESIAEDESNYYEIPIERPVESTGATDLSAFHLAPFMLNESLQFNIVFDIIHEIDGGRAEV